MNLDHLLITGLQAHNFGGSLTGAGSVQGTLFPRDSSQTEGMTKLSFEPQFPRFNPQSLDPNFADTIASNSVQLYKLVYIFPSGINNLSLFCHSPRFSIRKKINWLAAT